MPFVLSCGHLYLSMLTFSVKCEAGVEIHFVSHVDIQPPQHLLLYGLFQMLLLTQLSYYFSSVPQLPMLFKAPPPMHSYSHHLPHPLSITCQVLCEALGVSGAEEREHGEGIRDHSCPQQGYRPVGYGHGRRSQRLPVMCN